jgi:hypothetical protein
MLMLDLYLEWKKRKGLSGMLFVKIDSGIFISIELGES